MKTIQHLLLLFLSVTVHSQTINEKIDEVMKRYQELDQFSGNVLLAKEGKVLYSKSFGEANKSFKIKNTINTKFNIASMGKMFTGVSVMQLQERGKLNIDDPVIKYLDDFPFGKSITILHLLSHSSGLGSYMSDPDYRVNRSRFRTTHDLVTIVYKQKLRFKNPGERFSYSNSGMIILGAIIEKVTGKTYWDYIRENILIPLKMNNTSMKSWDEVLENRAIGYIKSISGKFRNNVYHNSHPHADGGVFSTVEDLLKFDQALYSSSLINEKSKEKMFTVIFPKLTYALAFQVEERYGNKIVGHAGGMPGVSSYFSRYLKDKYTIIVLSNYDMISKNVAHYIEDILYRKEYRLPRPRLGRFIYDNMKTMKALASPKALSAFIKKRYSIQSPVHLNMIAYQFMHEGERDFAIKLFLTNVHLFPNEANPYDSLAEAYEKNKEYHLALRNYQKAIELAEKNSDPSLNSFKSNLERFKNKRK